MATPLVDGITILQHLCDANDVKRQNALVQLRSLLKETGSLPFTNSDQLFEHLDDCLQDEQWTVHHECLLLIGDIAPHIQPASTGSLLIVLPRVVISLGSPHLVIRKAARESLAALFRYAPNTMPILRLYIQFGFNSTERRVRQESIEAVQHVLTSDVDNLSFELLVPALIDKLRDDSDVVVVSTEKALAYVLKLSPSSLDVVKQLMPMHQQLLHEHMDAIQQLMAYRGSRPRSRGLLTSDGDFGSKQSDMLGSSAPVNGTQLEFGFVPVEFVEQLRAKDIDFVARLSAVDSIHHLFDSMSDVTPLLSNLGGFLRFCCELFDDPNFKVSLKSRQIVEEVINKLRLQILPHLDFLVPQLVQKFADNKIASRHANLKVFSTLLARTSPPTVCQLLLRHVHDSNWHVREQVLHVVTYAVLAHRDANFDQAALVRSLLSLLSDSKSNVRRLALEALAVLHDTHGSALRELVDQYCKDLSHRALLQDRWFHRPPTLVDGAVVFSAYFNRSASEEKMNQDTNPRVVSAGVSSTRKIPFALQRTASATSSMTATSTQSQASRTSEEGTISQSSSSDELQSQLTAGESDYAEPPAVRGSSAKRPSPDAELNASHTHPSTLASSRQTESRGLLSSPQGYPSSPTFPSGGNTLLSSQAFGTSSRVASPTSSPTAHMIDYGNASPTPMTWPAPQFAHAFSNQAPNVFAKTQPLPSPHTQNRAVSPIVQQPLAFTNSNPYPAAGAPVLMASAPPNLLLNSHGNGNARPIPGSPLSGESRGTNLVASENTRYSNGGYAPNSSRLSNTQASSPAYGAAEPSSPDGYRPRPESSAARLRNRLQLNLEGAAHVPPYSPAQNAYNTPNSGGGLHPDTRNSPALAAYRSNSIGSPAMGVASPRTPSGPVRAVHPEQRHMQQSLQNASSPSVGPLDNTENTTYTKPPTYPQSPSQPLQSATTSAFNNPRTSVSEATPGNRFVSTSGNPQPSLDRAITDSSEYTTATSTSDSSDITSSSGGNANAQSSSKISMWLPQGSQAHPDTPQKPVNGVSTLNGLSELAGQNGAGQMQHPLSDRTDITKKTVGGSGAGPSNNLKLLKSRGARSPGDSLNRAYSASSVVGRTRSDSMPLASPSSDVVSSSSTTSTLASDAHSDAPYTPTTTTPQRFAPSVPQINESRSPTPSSTTTSVHTRTLTGSVIPEQSPSHADVSPGRASAQNGGNDGQIPVLQPRKAVAGRRSGSAAYGLGSAPPSGDENVPSTPAVGAYSENPFQPTRALPRGDDGPASPSLSSASPSTGASANALPRATEAHTPTTFNAPRPGRGATLRQSRGGISTEPSSPITPVPEMSRAVTERYSNAGGDAYLEEPSTPRTPNMDNSSATDSPRRDSSGSRPSTHQHLRTASTLTTGTVARRNVSAAAGRGARKALSFGADAGSGGAGESDDGGKEPLTPSYLDRVEASYLTTEELKPFENPEAELKNATRNLKSEMWDARFEAINDIRRLAVNHTAVLDPALRALMTPLKKEIESLRSSLAKNSLMCVTELFQNLPKVMDPEIEKLAPLLFKRSADQPFLAEEADKALYAMLCNCNVNRCLSGFLGVATHKSQAIRTKVAEFFVKAVEIIGIKMTSSKEYDRVIQRLAASLEEGANEIRTFGKQAVLALARLCGALEFENSCKRLLSSQHFSVVKKVLDKGLDHELTDTIHQNLAGTAGAGVNKNFSATRFPRRASGPLKPSSRSNSGSDINQPSGTTENGEGDAPLMLRGRSSRTDLTRPETRTGTADAKADKNAKQPRQRRQLSAAAVKRDAEQLEPVFVELRAADWKVRNDALGKLVDAICEDPDLGRDNVTKVVDELLPRLSDSNAKVNVAALESLLLLLPKLSTSLELTTKTLVPVLVANLATRQPQVRELSKSALDSLGTEIDKNLLIEPYSLSIQHGNVALRPTLLLMLSDILPDAVDARSVALTKHVLPVAFQLLEERKADVRDANAALIRAIYSIMGDALFETSSAARLNPASFKTLQSFALA